MDFLLTFRAVDQNVVAQVAQIILVRAEGDPYFAHALSPLFIPFSQVNEHLNELFSGNIPALKRSYLVYGSEPHRGRLCVHAGASPPSPGPLPWSQCERLPLTDHYPRWYRVREFPDKAILDGIGLGEL